VRFYIAPYLTPCGASSERGECLTWVRLTDRQPRRRTRTAFSLGFAWAYPSPSPALPQNDRVLLHANNGMTWGWVEHRQRVRTQRDSNPGLRAAQRHRRFTAP